MIRFECDKCREIIPKGKSTNLTLKAQDILLYDICPSCLSVIKEMIGEGRKYIK